MKKRKVKWACPECDYETKTEWDWEDCMPGEITLHCEACEHEWIAIMEPDAKWVKKWRAYAK